MRGWHKEIPNQASQVPYIEIPNSQTPNYKIYRKTIYQEKSQEKKITQRRIRPLRVLRLEFSNIRDLKQLFKIFRKQRTRGYQM